MNIFSNLYRKFFGNFFANNQPITFSVEELNSDNLNSVTQKTTKRISNTESENICPKKRKVTPCNFVGSGHIAIGTSLFGRSSNSKFMKPTATIDLNKSKRANFIGGIIDLSVDENDEAEKLKPIASIDLSKPENTNVISEIINLDDEDDEENSSVELNCEAGNSWNVLKPVNNLIKPLRRSPRIKYHRCSSLVQVNQERSKLLYHEMLRQRAGSSAHTRSERTLQKTLSSTEVNRVFENSLISPLIPSGPFFFRKLTPSTPMKTITSTDSSLSSKAVIDLTNDDEESDAVNHERIRAKIRASPRIRDMKSSMRIQNEQYIDPNSISKIVQDHKEMQKEVKAKSEKLKREMRENQDQFHDALSKLLEQQLSIKERRLKEEVQPSWIVAPMTPKMIETSNKILTSRKEPLVRIKDTGIKIQDIRTLNDGAWLNDEVINAYMNLIMLRSETHPAKYPKVHCFNTFLYLQLQSRGYWSLRRWTRKIDIFEYALIIVPIHLGNHWCLIEMRMTDKMILYYDSLGSTNNRCLEAMLQYLVDEQQDKKNEQLDSSEWKLCNVLPDEIPRQKNAYDCGVFACTYAEHLTRRSPLNFDQEHMPYFRQKMTYEILTGSLIL